VSIDVLRAIRSLVPDVEVIHSDAPADESYGGAYGKEPNIANAECVEGRVLRSHRVIGKPEVRFAGFLDGIQRARIACHQHGIPIIDGTVAAVVRVRVDRRFRTWGHRAPLVSRRLYMPLALLGCEGSSAEGIDIVDTSCQLDGAGSVSRHPAALRSVAFQYVGRDRELAEQKLGELWCVDGAEPLFIDGGISGSGRVAASGSAVGVVKSHRTLYADGAALDVVMALRCGERSSVFAPSSSRRSPIISWYLRLRDPKGQDAMFGLVRIEASAGGDIESRANEISRWVLAETTPLSLPDGRWDRMAYGVRDCEQFLRAIA